MGEAFVFNNDDVLGLNVEFVPIQPPLVHGALELVALDHSCCCVSGPDSSNHCLGRPQKLNLSCDATWLCVCVCVCVCVCICVCLSATVHLCQCVPSSVSACAMRCGNGGP